VRERERERMREIKRERKIVKTVTQTTNKTPKQRKQYTTNMQQNNKTRQKYVNEKLVTHAKYK